MAVFKFSSLLLAGNPTISLLNGGASNLALISVGNITTGTALTTFTFAGLDSLLLATQNGSITIGSNITFQNIPTLFLYARGADSTLTFDGLVNGTTNLVLFAENNIQVTNNLTVNQTTPVGFTGGIFDTIIAGNALNVGGDLTLSIDSSGTNNDSGINVSTNTGPLTVGGLLGLTITSTSGAIANGASLNLNAGTDLSADSLALTLDLASAQTTVGNGANIVVIAGGDISITNDATFTLLHNGGGTITNGGQIFVQTGGDFTAGSINALINNRDGGIITTGGSLVFAIGGALATTGDTSLVLSGRDDGGGGGSFASGADISLSAGSISIGGLLNVGTGLSAGGSVLHATANIFSSGAVSATGGLVLNIQNGGVNINGDTTGGTAITNDVAISLTAASVASGDVLDLFVNNLNGGAIGGTASVGFSTTGAVTVGSDALFEIVSGSNPGVTLRSSIGGDALVTFNSASFSAASLLTDIINQDGASIGGNAALSFTTTGALNTTGDAIFRILNSDDGQGLGGGVINGDATIDVNAGSISTGGFFNARIFGQNGTILGNRAITVSVGGALVTGSDANFTIFEFPPSGGPPPEAFSIAVTAGSINVAGSLNANVNVGSDNPIFLTDNVSVSANQNVTVGGAINIFGSLNAGGNVIAGSTILIGGGSLTAGGNVTSTAGDITLQLGPTTFGALSAGGSISAQNLRALTIDAGTNVTVGSTLGGPFVLQANSIVAGGAVNLLNVSSVIGATSTFGPNGGFTPDPFTLSANSLTVVLSIPALTFNGSDG